MRNSSYVHHRRWDSNSVPGGRIDAGPGALGAGRRAGTAPRAGHARTRRASRGGRMGITKSFAGTRGKRCCARRLGSRLGGQAASGLPHFLSLTAPQTEGGLWVNPRKFTRRLENYFLDVRQGDLGVGSAAGDRATPLPRFGKVRPSDEAARSRQSWRGHARSITEPMRGE